MISEDIIRLAREASSEHDYDFPNIFALERFAALVAAAEREACAKLCEETTASWTQHLYNAGCVDCAAAIRARGSK